MKMRAMVGSLVLVALSSQVEARVVRLKIDRREPILNGRSFGLPGPYEKLVGTVEFALDPRLLQNAAVVDLSLAPKNAKGEVELSADFYLLKPVDMKRGNGRLVYEVPNRGGKGILRSMQSAQGSLDPTTEAEFGDGWLLEQGFAVVWMGWQWDVPETPRLLRLHAPITSENGKPITGMVRANIILSERQPSASLADRGHIPYPVLDRESPENTMTVRAHRLDPAQVVPHARWRFDTPGSVALEGGFEPGKIYDVVYRSKDPRVAGCSLTATRDLVSFFKNEAGEGNPLAGVKRALALGVSQSGRFLRHFLYQGFNEDENARRVFDGVFVQVAGAGRGSFNHRFAQASRDGYRHLNLLYPTDIFPFTDAPEADPETGESDGILVRASKNGTAPRVFHVLSSFEYWNRAGSLIHTNAEGTADAVLPETSRIYHMASSQHGPGSLPPSSPGTPQNRGQALSNTNDYAPALRALFHALDRWVSEEAPPPASLYPRVAQGTLATPQSVEWPKIPEVPFPLILNDAYRVDYGPDWKARGIIGLEPPRVGRAFGARVPAVDADGNELGGLRLPEIEVPLGTATGWNFRHPDTGAPDELVGVLGSYFPFATTRAARQAVGDPRPSVEERYRDKDQYVGKITSAALRLVKDRYLLPEDVPRVVERAAAQWDWIWRSASTALNPDSPEPIGRGGGAPRHEPIVR